MNSTFALDLYNLDLIYHPTFQYSLPRKNLENFISGKAFDHPNFYTEEESTKLREDTFEIYHNMISKNPVQEKIAIMTAGAPGAGKTTKLRQIIEENSRQGKHYAYICPDDVCLQGQERTYLDEIKNSDKSPAARQMIYNKWRPASNAITHLILANLIRQNYGFYFGTTSTGPATGKFLTFLKNQGYKIRLIHIKATSEVRWGSIKERDKTFVQTTEKDITEKGDLLPQRINDAFLAFADEIEFYYRDDVNKEAVLSAKWQRNDNPQPHLGSLSIVDHERYEKIKAIHNMVVKNLGRPELLWESTVEKSSNILNV
jgi:predicted ABC-type ATPase